MLFDICIQLGIWIVVGVGDEKLKFGRMRNEYKFGEYVWSEDDDVLSWFQRFVLSWVEIIFWPYSFSSPFSIVYYFITEFIPF